MCSSDSDSCAGPASSDRGPASHPCGSCPYRKDVPSGVWHESEYEKLPRYDADTMEQPPNLFLCHQQNGRVCAGWAGCHDMDNNLAVRFSVMTGSLTVEEAQATVEYESPIQLHPSGAEAASHGMAGIIQPDEGARKIITKLERRAAKREGADA